MEKVRLLPHASCTILSPWCSPPWPPSLPPSCQTSQPAGPRWEPGSCSGDTWRTKNTTHRYISKIEAFFKKKKIINMLTDFEKCFGCKQNKIVLNYVILCTNFFIYRCKIQETKPSIQHWKNFMNEKQRVEYFIACKNLQRSMI